MIYHNPDIALLRTQADQAASLLQAVGNPRRLLVLCLLADQGEMSVSALNALVPLSASALSQHLARMRQENLIAFRREGQTLYYRICDPKVATLLATLQAIFCPDGV